MRNRIIHSFNKPNPFCLSGERLYWIEGRPLDLNQMIGRINYRYNIHYCYFMSLDEASRNSIGFVR